MTQKEITIFICEDIRTSKKIINQYLNENEITYVNVLASKSREEVIKKIEELES
jgi:16S rRNA C1402 (ribose-2'-O) methylase RsmI